MDISTLNAVYNPSASSLAAMVYQPLSLAQQSLDNVTQSSASYQTQISDYGQIQGLFASLQDSAQGLTDSSIFSATATNSSSPSVLTATSSSGTATGSYNIQVNQLAQGETLLSSAQSGTSSAIGSGSPSTVSVQLANGTSQSITIDNSNNTLSGIAAAINSANLGISAAIVSNNSGYQLALTGQTGASNAFSITTSGDAAITNLLNYQSGGSANGMSQTAAAQDAQGSINGTSFSSATNVVTNAVNGVALNLIGTGSATVTITPDASQATKAVQSFVNAYNAAQTAIGKYQSGDLAGDVTLPDIQGQLASALNTIQSSLSGPYSALAQVGITTNPDGTLAFDAQAFSNAMTANPGNVAQLFSNNGNGMADQMLSQLGGITGTAGAIQSETSGLQSEIQFNQELQAGLSSSTNDLQKSFLGQYTQLQSMLSSMQSVSQFLGAQFPQASIALPDVGNMTPGQMADSSIISNLAAQMPGIQFSGLAAQYDMTQGMP